MTYPLPSHAASIWLSSGDSGLEHLTCLFGPTPGRDKSHSITVPLTEAGLRQIISILRTREAARSDDELSIGTDGAPTDAQALHLRRHARFPSPKCPFCRLMQARVDKIADEATRRATRFVADGTVRVRQIPPGQTALGAKTQRTFISQKSARDLGL